MIEKLKDEITVLLENCNNVIVLRAIISLLKEIEKGRN